MPNKREFTKKLLAENPDAVVNDALKIWWYNIRNDGGLRLTERGFKTFVDSFELEYYEWDLPTTHYLNPKLLLELDKHMTYPYFIEHLVKKFPAKIYIFGAKEATAITLYGDIKNYLETI